MSDLTAIRFIASAGTYANLVKQAKSKQKVRYSKVPDSILDTQFLFVDHR